MKLNKFILVSMILLAVISLGAVSAASDATADDTAVGVTEELDLAASDVGEISADGDDIAVGSDVIKDGDVLSAGSVTPNYTIEVTPDVKDAGGNYVAQYGQVITVSGIFENVTGNIAITFGYSGNYHDFDVPLVDGKFSQDITCYDRVRNNYQIQVKYAGDDYYKSVSWSKNIHVQMENVTANGAYYGLAAYMDINMFDATGDVTCIVNDEVNYTGKLENGKLYIEIRNYTVGKNYVDFIYSGDDRFNPIEKSFTFNVDANVRAPTIYNYEEAIVEVYFGEATGKATIALGNETHELDIVDGKVATEIENYKIGNNTIDVTYSGDSTFHPFKTIAILTVLDKEDATIISSVYQTASQNFIFINVPHATGNITVTVNGKEEEWELVDGTVKKDIAPSDAINELIVSYAGNERLNPTTSSFYVNLTDYVVNDKTFRNYFDLSNDGKLYDFLEDGITLDFQGVVFINPNTENEVNIEISKPINIISSTNDAYIDLNTTAGSLLGEHPGSSFIVGHAGSGSNISGIYLHNTELWVSNTTNVVFDNISVVVEDQRVGSGVGATSVRDNSSYVTIKNSYFYTRNNGGSTTFTFSWATYCVFDNNTVKAEGNVGNLLYLNVYNIKNLPEPTKTSWGDILPNYPLNNHNAFINNRLYGKEGSAISVGIMVEGEYNLIANNTLYKTSISTSMGGTGANHNTYSGNILMEGSGLTAQTESIIYDNYVPGTLATGANSTAFDNVAGKMTVGANSFAYNNTVNGTMTVSGANAGAHQNTVDAMTVSGAGANVGKNTIHTTATVSGSNVVFFSNVIGIPENNGALSASASDVAGDSGSLKVTGKNDTISNNFIYGVVSITGANTAFDLNTVTDVVTVSSNDNKITGNEITTKGDYAIDLTSSSGNTVEYNRLISADKKGDDAVKSEGDNDVEKNMGQQIMTIVVNDCWAIENNNITITVPGATGNVTVRVNEKEYVEVPLVDGKVTIEVSSDDMEVGLNEVDVTYNGDASIDPDSDYALFSVFDDTVTPETFYVYFDETGILRSNVPYDELTFKGTFENLTDYIIINRPIYIGGYRVKLVNMGMTITSENVTIEDLVFEADESLGDLISVCNDNVEILWVEINYVVGDEEACAIAIIGSENVKVYRCDVYFESNITSDDKPSYAINVLESENVVIDRNEIIARLPGLIMKTYDYSYFGMGLAYVNGVRIYESEGVNFTNNELDVAYLRIVDQSYPDVQAMIVAGSENVLIDGNDISIIDTLVQPGSTVGIVGIQFIGNDDVTVSNNEFQISTQGGASTGGGTAYPITIIGTSMDIIGNEIYTEDNGPNLGIYMPMGFAAGKLVNIVGNDIEVVGNVTAKDSWALISGVEVQAGSANIYANDINVYNKAGYNESYAVTGVSMYQYGYSTVDFDIQNNTIITNGRTTVYIPTGNSANITGNALYAEELFGDASVDSTIPGVVENNAPPFEPVIEIRGGGWYGLDGVVTVTVKGVIGIPYNSTGNVTIKVGSKTFKDLQLVNGTVTQTVDAEDLVLGHNLVTVTYTGDKYTLAGEGTGNIEVVSGVITNETFFNYFDKDNGNYLFDYIPEGATLDFQGLFVGANYSLYINKPVNIISSTGDAFFDSGANPNRNWVKFNIVEGANHTNLTGLKFLNADLFVIGASYVTIDDVNMVAKMSGVGSGTGFLSIHSNAYYTVVKNSFFENGGTGSSILVLGKGGKYATFDNNEFLITGSSGNILSSNVYVGSGEIPQCVNYTNNFINNTMSGSGFCYGITVCGEGNLIENNTLYHKGAGIITQYGANTAGNVYRNNVLYNGCTMSVGDNSIVENNYVEAGLTIASGVKAYNNTAKTMTISGANAIVEGSTVGETKISGKNVTFAFNELTGLLTVSSSDNTIQFNNIMSDSEYAVDLQDSENNTVTNNVLHADELWGDDAVNFVEGKGNIVKDNYPIDPELEVTVEDIDLGEVAIINISMNDGVNDDVLVVVDAKLYVVPVSGGKGQLNVSDLDASTYTVAVMYKGDDEFAPSIKYTEFDVCVYATYFTDITVENNKITAYLIDATGDAVGNAPIKCFINGIESNATTAADGSVIINDVAGSTVVLIFEGAIPLLPADITINMNITPTERTATQLFAEDFTQYACDYAAGEKGGYFKVQIKDANGNPLANKTIAVGFNGVVGYYQSDAEGWIEKQIALASAGEYTFASIFLGDENYTASFIVNKITIVKKPTSISASAKSYKASASKKSFSATLKTIAGSSIDGKVYLSAGKKITFTVNGKTYTAKTDSKGKATVNLKLTKKGKYTLKVSFAGDNTYKASSKSVKITIK